MIREHAPRSHALLLVGEDGVVLARRVEDGSVWYQAPGVAVQEGETPGRAAARAAREQLGVDVEVGDLVYADTELGLEHYFFAVLLPEGVDTDALTAQADRELVVLRRAALLAYRVEPAPIARLLLRRRDSVVTDW